ncbi:MAG: hypothetical protein M1355_04030 [Patescibacteria group bacterium]|nr:hypothetical protein [Patescibacteria group bacterium]
MWPTTVFKSKERVLLEIQKAANEFGAVFLSDDNAAMKKNELKWILRQLAKTTVVNRLLLQMEVKSVFKTDGSIDWEFLGVLEQAANTVIVCYGVESPLSNNLKTVGKGINAIEMDQGLWASQYAGLLNHLMMFVMPTDTLDIFPAMLSLSLKWGSTLQDLHYILLPGTEMAKEYSHLALWDLDTNPSHSTRYRGMCPNIWYESMTPLEAQKGLLWVYESFYSWDQLKVSISRGWSRHRNFNPAQQAYLESLSLIARKKQAVKWRLEYKFVEAGTRYFLGMPTVKGCRDSKEMTNIMRDLEELERERAIKPGILAAKQ